MELLPSDLKYAILVRLEWPETRNICASNKTFHTLCSNDLYWRLKYLFDFGNPYRELQPAKEGYFNQYRYRYLQKVKEDMYLFMYQKIDEKDKERFPDLFAEYYTNFCTEIGPDVKYYYRMNDKFFYETQIKMSQHPSLEVSSPGSVENMIQQLTAYCLNAQEIAAFITTPIQKIINNQRFMKQ